MGRQRRAASASDLEAVRERIEHWRATREKRSPMPEELWTAAVDLARTHGISPVVRALRVGYGALRCRLGETVVSASAGVATGITPARFVEVPTHAIPWPDEPMPQTDVTPALMLTLYDGGGSRLELRVREASAGVVDVAALTRAWSARQR